MYKIPDYTEEPSFEMIDFLHENPNDWDGDECGIVLYNDSESDEPSYRGGPGDWVYKDEDGIYRVKKSDEVSN